MSFPLQFIIWFVSIICMLIVLNWAINLAAYASFRMGEWMDKGNRGWKYIFLILLVFIVGIVISIIMELGRIS